MSGPGVGIRWWYAEWLASGEKPMAAGLGRIAGRCDDESERPMMPGSLT